MTQPELQARLEAVRRHYGVTPWISPRNDETPLLRSWQRCYAAGMREHERVNFELVSRAWLAELDDRHGALVQQARPETERLAQALRGTGAAVLLFDTRGMIIDRLCHEASASPHLLATTRVGINAAETCVGTTAPAIALNEGVPYLVGRDAHFFDNTRPFFCVAAPIDDPQGERVAALDITSFDSVPGFDVMSLVVDAAMAIENSLFRATADRVVVRFHPRAELVGTGMAGMLEIDDAGTVTGANRTAARLLCQPRSALRGRGVGSLFDGRGPHLFGRCQPGGLVELRTASGLRVVGSFEGDLDPGQAATDTAAQSASMREVELRAIQRALAAAGGNVSAAARQLGISRNTIYRRLPNDALPR